MKAETFSPGTTGLITNLVMSHQWMKEVAISMEIYSAGAFTDNDSMVNKDITSESAVSRTIFPHFCYLNFMKFPFLCFHVVVATHENLSIDVSNYQLPM